MQSFTFTKGSLGKTIPIFLTHATTKDGLTGLAYNTAGLTAYYWRPGSTASVAITLVAGTVGSYLAGGFKEIDATNMQGIYQFGIPDACLASNASFCMIEFLGAANLQDTPVLLNIEHYDLSDVYTLGAANTLLLEQQQTELLTNEVSRLSKLVNRYQR